VLGRCLFGFARVTDSAVQTMPVPAASLLGALVQSGCYGDCFTATVPGEFTHAQFVEAFYTSAWFKAERVVLRWLAASPSTDAQARELGAGARDRFAVWHVAQRAPNQILLTDRTGRTSSWLMAEHWQVDGSASTRLYFGSAIHPRRNTANGKPQFSWVFHALLGLHEAYSRRLLRSAARGLMSCKVSEA
jgi:hypothetical protein